MMEDDPRRRSSSDTRQALTVTFVKPDRGACWNQSINSFSAMLYTRFVIGEETLSSTSAFTSSHRAIFPNTIISFILGVLLFGIIGHSNITSWAGHLQEECDLTGHAPKSGHVVWPNPKGRTPRVSITWAFPAMLRRH